MVRYLPPPMNKRLYLRIAIGLGIGIGVGIPAIITLIWRAHARASRAEAKLYSLRLEQVAAANSDSIFALNRAALAAGDAGWRQPAAED